MVGLSEKGLGVRRLLAGHAQSDGLPGLVALVSGSEDRHVEAIGSMSAEGSSLRLTTTKRSAV